MTRDISHRINADATSLSGEPATFAGGLHDLGSGLFAWLQPNGGLGEANCGLIVGSDGTAVVDTCWDHRQARRFLDAVDPCVRDAPIRHVVNTHSNGDHWWGNALMPAEAEIITSKASLDAMHRESPQEMALIQKALNIGKRLPGPIGADCRYGAAQFAPFDFGEVRLRWPTETFVGVHRIELGSRTVELIEVGPAHTPGDLLVHVPDARVVFAGDILFNKTTPIMWDGPVLNWIKAIETIMSLEAETIVSGHGPLAGSEDLAELHSYWCWLQQEVPPLHARGWSYSRAATELVTSRDFRTSPWARWRGPELIVGNVAAVYRNIEHRGGELSPLAMVQVFSSIARLARRLRVSGCTAD